jgi:hypothetical protein
MATMREAGYLDELISKLLRDSPCDTAVRRPLGSKSDA